MDKNSYDLGVLLLKELAKKEPNILNVMTFIKSGADLSLLHNTARGKNKGVQAIIYAMQKDLTQVVKLMGEMKANLNAKDNQGNTPLHIAVLNKNKELVAYLLGQNILPNVKNNENKTPLDLAQHLVALATDSKEAKGQKSHFVKKSNTQMKTLEEIIDLFKNQEAIAKEKAIKEAEQIAKEMHQSALAKKYETAVIRLHHFTKKDKIEEYALKIQNLLEQGMDIDHPIKELDNSTLLHVLCLKIDEIKFDKNGTSCDLTLPTVMRKYKPNPFVENKQGYTPMMLLSILVENSNYYGSDIKRAKKLNLHLLSSYERSYQSKTIGKTLEPLAILATLYQEKNNKAIKEIVNKAGDNLLKLAFVLQGKHVHQKED